MRKRILYALAVLGCAASSCDKAEGVPGPAERTFQGVVETYIYSRDVPWSRQYDVTVNGETQRVIATAEPEICIFGCTDTVEVRITALADRIETVTVRPKGKNPIYRTDGNSIILHMAPYDRYDIEINGNEETPLFLFANPVDTAKPDRNDPNVVFFASGEVYDTGALTLKSGQTLYIEGGAIVNGMVSASGADNISIAGGGILDGRRQNGKKVRLTECRNVTLKDLTVLGATDWTTYIVKCDGIVADGYKAIATFSAKPDNSGNENDTFDLMACNHATIRRCFCYCHDDAYCIKTQKWLVSGTSTDITFQDCIAWNKDCGNSFVVGYEVNQDVSAVLFKDCHAIHSAGAAKPLRRAAVSIHNGAGGTLSDIRFENIHIEDPKESGIYIEIIKSGYDIGNGVEWTPGHIRNVTLKDIHMGKIPPYGNVLSGYDDGEHKIEGLVIDGVHVASKRVRSLSECGPYTCKNTDITHK